MLKINPMEKNPKPQSLLGAIPSEINMPLPYSTQEKAHRSIHATFVGTYGLSANKINNNSQCSSICGSIPEIGPGLSIHPRSTINNKNCDQFSPSSELSNQKLQFLREFIFLRHWEP